MSSGSTNSCHVGMPRTFAISSSLALVGLPLSKFGMLCLVIPSIFANSDLDISLFFSISSNLYIFIYNKLVRIFSFAKVLIFFDNSSIFLLTNVNK